MGRWPVAVLFCALIAFSLAANLPKTSEQEVTDVRLLSDLAYPAVVLIYAEVTGEIDTPDYRITATIAGFGTGFFVNPHGYIATCGHVVFAFDNNDPAQDSIVRYYLLYRAAMLLVEYFRRQGYQLTKSDIELIFNYVFNYGKITKTNLDVYVMLGEAVGADIKAKGIKARVVVKSPFIEKDIAIIKVDLKNTPTLLLGDSDEVKVGDEVYAVGYPGVVVFHEMLSEESMLIPSITKGIISAKRKTKFDTPALQTDVSVTHGNSGGPALSKDGKVIGVVNMGSVDPERRMKVAGFNFLVPSNIVRDFLKENGIANEEGATDRLYRKALALFYAKCYDSAIREFNALLNIFPYHWYAKKLIAEAQKAMAEGEKAESSISVSVPTEEVEYGKDVAVSGKIELVHESPLPVEYDFSGITVRIEYTKPDGERITHTVSVDKNGYFSDTVKADKGGAWSVKVSWDGNKDMEGGSATASFKVSPPPVPPVVVVGVIAVVAIVAVVALVLVRRRKAPSAVPLPPPPPPRLG